MDAGKNHKASATETKNFITTTTVAIVTAFSGVISPSPRPHRAVRRGPDDTGTYSKLHNSKFRSLSFGSPSLLG